MKEELNYLNNLLKDNDTIVIALSGGPDSMCLFSLLLKVKEQKNINLIAAHVNHCTRKENVSEAEFVQNYCQEHNTIFETMTIEKYHNASFHENEARIIRYDFFRSIIKKYHANYLMTAHHGDDLIETILMRITRGSTLNGYAGFKKDVDKKDYRAIKPLITKTKKEIIEYNHENNIPFVTDQSNNNEHYTRNRYRKHILEFLKQEEPNIHQKYLRFSNTLLEYNNYVDNIVINNIKKIYQQDKLDLQKFKLLDDLIQKKVIEYILASIYHNDLIYVTDIHTKLIIEFINNENNSGTLNLPLKIEVIKSYNFLQFCQQESKITDYSYEFGNQIELPNNTIICVVDNSEEKSNFITRINSEEIKLPLVVRNRRDGDKMAIKKLNGTKKIKDIFIDSKVESKDRQKWPIVLDSNNTVIWVPGLKKSKFDKEKSEKYDIILKYEKKEK